MMRHSNTGRRDSQVSQLTIVRLAPGPSLAMQRQTPGQDHSFAEDRRLQLVPARRFRVAGMRAETAPGVGGGRSGRRGSDECVDHSGGGAVERSGAARDHEASRLLGLPTHGERLDTVGQRVERDWGECRDG
jgi:hypothetical protein